MIFSNFNLDLALAILDSHEVQVTKYFDQEILKRAQAELVSGSIAAYFRVTDLD
jgi:hypothetical protein